MENEESYVQPQSDYNLHLILTDQAQFYLQKAGKWASFIGIIGFVVTGFILLAAISVGALFSTIERINPMVQYPAVLSTGLTVFYLLFAVFNLFFSLYIYQFGTRIRKGIILNSIEDIALAFGKLKSFFKMWGIAIIVVIAFYVLIFLLTIFGSLAGLLGR